MLRTMRAPLLVALLLVLPSLVAAGTQYGNLFCEVLDEATTRSVNPTARRMHFAYCVDLATGDVLGALIRRKGATVCTETGSYDFSSFAPMLQAAREEGTQIIWDLCHYGWPVDVSLFSAAFVDRFA